MTEERKSVAVDFDGVLHQWDGEWRGHHVIPGEPIPGAIEWLHALLQTYDVFILTTRAETFRGRMAIWSWLKKHTPEQTWDDQPEKVSVARASGPTRGLHSIRATNRKRPALVYVDDRGFRFTGNNFPSINRVRGMRPWWKEPLHERGGEGLDRDGGVA